MYAIGPSYSVTLRRAIGDKDRAIELGEEGLEFALDELMDMVDMVDMVTTRDCVELWMQCPKGI